MERQKRNDFTKIRLTPDEKTALKKEAERLGITISSLIRNFVVIQQPIEPYK